MSILEVQCYHYKEGVQDGIQIVFHQEDGHSDGFDFLGKDNVDYFMNLIRLDVTPEALMVEARDRKGLVVH